MDITSVKVPRDAMQDRKHGMHPLSANYFSNFMVTHSPCDTFLLMRHKIMPDYRTLDDVMASEQRTQTMRNKN